MFCATADGKLEHRHITGEKEPRRDDEEKFPRLLLKIVQFCELLS